MIIKDSKGITRTTVQILQDKNALLPLYIGLDYSYNDVKCLYINAIIRLIEIAEENNLDYVVSGQNSYFPKTLSGAILQRSMLGFNSHKPFYSFLVKKVFRYLFPEHVNNIGLFYHNNAEKLLDDFCFANNIKMLPYKKH